LNAFAIEHARSPDILEAPLFGVERAVYLPTLFVKQPTGRHIIDFSAASSPDGHVPRSSKFEICTG